MPEARLRWDKGIPTLRGTGKAAGALAAEWLAALQAALFGQGAAYSRLLLLHLAPR